MEKLKNTIKNNLTLIMLITSAVLILGGIILMVLGIGKAEATFNIVMFVIISLVMIALGCTMIYFVVLTKGDEDETPNLFLYDPQTETNLDESVLDFELVDKRMAFFMSRIASSIKDIWGKNIFVENEDDFDGVDELKSLLAYKMLYDLAVRDNPALWSLYLNADADLIETMEQQIRNNGDEFGRYIVKLHATANGSYEKSKKFLTDNKAYLESKMLTCVKNNIEKF